MPVQRQNPARGFSLVELVAAVAIIAIACAIVLPHWSNSVRNYQLTLAARRVAADLAWAQSLANSSSSSITITFSLDSSQYQLAGVPDPDRPAQTYTVDLTADPYHARLVPPSGSSGATTVIIFNGFGSPTQTGSVTVASGVARKTVSVDPVTGQITVQ